MRLTKSVRQQILNMNNGFTTKTSYADKNSSYDRVYKIVDGALHVFESGKTSWADSHYDKQWIADDEEVHRFIYKFINKLKK